MFILDTDVLSELRRRRPNQAFLHWLEAIGWRELAITAITIMEIRFGIETVRRSNPAVAATVEGWLDGLVKAGGLQILPLDVPAAQILGRMYAVPALRTFFTTSPTARQVKTGADLAIAVIAISQKAVVITNNLADFQFVHQYFPLVGLFNPLSGEWRIPCAGSADASGS